MKWGCKMMKLERRGIEREQQRESLHQEGADTREYLFAVGGERGNSVPYRCTLRMEHKYVTVNRIQQLFSPENATVSKSWENMTCAMLRV